MTKRELMILDWTRKVHQLEYAHYFESTMYSHLNNILSISVLVITTIVATSFTFPEISKEEFDNLFFLFKQEYFAAIFSAVAAIFTAIITFLRPNEKSEKHRKIGLEYEKIRHEFEKVYTYNLTETSIEFKANKVKERWDTLDTLYVFPLNYKRGKQRVEQYNYPEPMSFLK